MKRIQKVLKAIGQIIQNPWLLNKVLTEESIWERHLKKQYADKQSLPVVQINALFPGFKETVDYFAFLDGGSLPTDIALLKNLCRRFQNCQYFEIGTWRGESIANMSEVAEACYTLNLSYDELIRLGGDKRYAELQGFFSKNKSNIHHLTGNSLTFDFAGLAKKFDVIFIDGDHHYEFVKNDSEKVFRHLTHDKSVVVWHDYAWHPEKVRPEVLAAILDGTPKAFHSNLYHVSNTMCAIYHPETLASSPLTVPSVPQQQFSLQIESKKVTYPPR